ncbi:MAG: YraN family protein [Candidatus Zixiibacteriota bacterium]|nr:MAG: YraN family protein [candidate division Zixibacteria bacterium]
MPRARRNAGDIGRRYEAQAALFFEQNGYVVRARNWRAGHKEIDLVVQKGKAVVFVEVKASRTDTFGHPSEKVTHKKIQNLTQAARQYLIDEGIDEAELRFDVVTFTEGKLEHYPGAFEAAD